MRTSRVPAILASAAFAAMLMPGQFIPHPATNGGNGPVGGSSAIGLAPAGGTTSPSASHDAIVPGTLFFGKVVMPDGTSPPSQVVIERVCSGAARPQAFTDSSGNFSFQVGQTPDMVPDATINRMSAGSPQSSSVSGYACDLRASLTGYRSDVVSLGSRRNMGDSNLGTIFLHRLPNTEGLTVSATSALAPKDARKAFEKGLEAVKRSKFDQAQAGFEKATALYPRYAAAWFELGRVLEQREHPAEARGAYAKAIAADSKFVSPYVRLYLLSLKEQNWEEVAATTERIMRLNPYDFPNAALHNAVANCQLERLDAAEKSARQAAAMHGSPKANYVLAVILAKKQDFKGAVECLRAYLNSDAISDRERVARMLADIEKQLQASN
ncbi:MAG: tetratricopeptide repeat protein [Bryobacteraceae bacterium]